SWKGLSLFAKFARWGGQIDKNYLDYLSNLSRASKLGQPGPRLRAVGTHGLAASEGMCRERKLLLREADVRLLREELARRRRAAAVAHRGRNASGTRVQGSRPPGKPGRAAVCRCWHRRRRTAAERAWAAVDLAPATGAAQLSARR